MDALKWLAVALFIGAYLCILIIPYWKRRNAAHAGERHGRLPPPIDAAELKQRLQRIASEHPELDVEIAGEVVLVSWNLDRERHRAHAHSTSPEATYALELQIADRSTVNVRYATGTIHWEPGTTEDSPIEPFIEWYWPLEQVGGPEPEFEPWEAGDPAKPSPRNLGHLVRLVKQCVLDAGYTWQPALEINPGAGATPVRQGVEQR